MRDTAATMSRIWGQEVRIIFSSLNYEKGQIRFLDTFIFHCLVLAGFTT